MAQPAGTRPAQFYASPACTYIFIIIIINHYNHYKYYCSKYRGWADPGVSGSSGPGQWGPEGSRKPAGGPGEAEGKAKEGDCGRCAAAKARRPVPQIRHARTHANTPTCTHRHTHSHTKTDTGTRTHARQAVLSNSQNALDPSRISQNALSPSQPLAKESSAPLKRSQNPLKMFASPQNKPPFCRGKRVRCKGVGRVLNELVLERPVVREEQHALHSIAAHFGSAQSGNALGDTLRNQT